MNKGIFLCRLAFRRLFIPIAPAASLLWFGCAPPSDVRPPSHPEASRLLPDLIEAGIQRGEKTIRIPEGRYVVNPINGVHLELRYLNGITLDMRGVELVCTETTQAILIDNCRDLTILGLTVDYDPLPFTQGELIEISEDRKTHLIQLHDGYPPAETVIPSKYIILKPDRTLRFGNYFTFDIEVLPNNRLKISNLPRNRDGGERVGDLITISSRTISDRFLPHAILVNQSHGTVLEDVTLYASPTFGFFETHSSNSVYRRCIIDRRGDRLRSLNADGFHSKFAEVGPTLEGCRAFWQGDDGINICGAYHMVLGSDEDRLRVLAKRDMEIQPGDPVQLVAVDGRALPNAKVLSVTAKGPASEEDRELLKSFRVLPRVQELLQTEYEIQIDSPVEMEAGGVIGALNRMGNGFVIRNSEFGHIRSRGILVKASQGLIENNLLVDCAMQAIKIAPEYNWLESGFSEQVTVRNNRIVSPGREAILVESTGNYPQHRDIQIYENTIETDYLPAVRIQGVFNGAFRENDLSAPSPEAGVEWIAVSHSPDFEVSHPSD